MVHLAELWRPVAIVRSLNPIASPSENQSNIPVGVTVFDAIVYGYGKLVTLLPDDDRWEHRLGRAARRRSGPAGKAYCP